MSRIKRILITLSASFGLLAPAVLPATVFAQTNDTKGGLCTGAELTTTQTDCATSAAGANASVDTLITNVINLFSLVVGIVAVIMIIVGGLKYITSGGDSGNVTGAKNTILYAVVGLIVVALAQVIVRFVLNQTSDITG
jgi:hypothetical protein